MFYVSIVLSMSFVFGHQLRSLADVSINEVSLQQSKPKLFVVFQPECDACHAQVKDLGCLAPTTDIVLAGAFGTEKALRETYQNFRTTYPGYLMTNALKKDLTLDSALTPQIVIVNNTKRVKMLGYYKCSSLKHILEAHFQQEIKKG